MNQNFHDLEVWLKQALTGDRTPTSDLGIINSLSQTGPLSRLLRTLLTDNGTICRVAARSYYHSNGFDKIVLAASTAPQYKLRLHIWWPNPRIGRDETNIHNHRWDFSSSVLAGALTSEEFVLSTEGTNGYRHLIYSPQAKDAYTIQVVGTSFLSCTRNRILHKGDAYWLPFDRLHRIKVDRTKVAATLFLQGADVASKTNVFTTQQTKKTGMIQVRRIGSSELHHKLVNLVAVLNI